MREPSPKAPDSRKRGGVLKSHAVKTDSSPGQGVTPLVARLLTTSGEKYNWGETHQTWLWDPDSCTHQVTPGSTKVKSPSSRNLDPPER